MSTSRRFLLIRFLAETDQRIELAKTLTISPMLTSGERRFAEEQLDCQRRMVVQVEKLLMQLS